MNGVETSAPADERPAAETSPQTVEVRFKGTRKAYFTWADAEAPLRLQEAVIVEAERGADFGRVSAVGETAAKKCAGSCTGCSTGTAIAGAAQGVALGEDGMPLEVVPADAGSADGGTAEAGTARPVLKSVLRRASQAEIRQANDLRRAEDDTRRKVAERVRHHQLAMKVSDCEWQWDRNKLTIFFTAEKRVDFRALVRDLASQFRTRIELRQIGVRDEAARLGGVGRCGKEFCCSTWLTDLSPVNLSLAKDQHLSLNPSQISGGCGRLLCCLKYEHEFYVQSRRRFPKEGKSVRTAFGTEKVIAVDIFRERVFLRSDEHGPRIVPLVQLKDEVESLGGLLPTPDNRALSGEAGVAAGSPAAPAVERRVASNDGGRPNRRRGRPRPGPDAPPSTPEA